MDAQSLYDWLMFENKPAGVRFFRQNHLPRMIPLIWEL